MLNKHSEIKLNLEKIHLNDASFLHKRKERKRNVKIVTQKPLFACISVFQLISGVEDSQGIAEMV